MVQTPLALSDVIRRLSAARDPACLVDGSGHFLFVNDAWDSGPDRDADLVGKSWLDGFSGEEVRRLHAEFLFHALQATPPARTRPEVHIVERNTPTSAVLVAMRMQQVVLSSGPLAVAITHTPVRERPIEEVYPVVERGAEELRDPEGRIVWCACCRRVRDPAEPDRWDLVPALVARPPEGGVQVLCGLCRELHYGQPPLEDA